MAKILLVEDDPFISEIYKKKLEASGFTVMIASSGSAVLKAIEENPLDLVLLDMVLPEMSGLEILEALKKKEGKYPNPDMLVIVFSNLSDPEDRRAALAAGAHGFFSKTEFTPSQLVDEIKKVLPASAQPTQS